MAYKVEYKESVEKDLKGVDRSRKAEILKSIDSDLAAAPRKKGKPLKGAWKGLWRYDGVRPYRVIYAVLQDETILIVRIGHRKDVCR